MTDVEIRCVKCNALLFVYKNMSLISDRPDIQYCLSCMHEERERKVKEEYGI